MPKRASRIIWSARMDCVSQPSRTARSGNVSQGFSILHLQWSAALLHANHSRSKRVPNSFGLDGIPHGPSHRYATGCFSSRIGQKRGLVRLNLISLYFTICAIGAVLLAFSAVVAFPLFLAAFGLSSIDQAITGYLRWPVMFGLIIVGVEQRFSSPVDNRARQAPIQQAAPRDYAWKK
jgi:hypothetical protein